ncbi:MAG: hypothetical protein QME12_03145 [Nanoarchaeota archaeon]|nr:hypothetical protein [Nanoarchaeota archaeon]
MAWIKAKHEGDLAGIAARLYHSNIILTDLDDTLAKSPMKKVACGFLKRLDMLANPKFIKWCAKAAWKKAVNGKKAESGLAREFVEKFIDGKESERIQRLVTSEYAISTLYPGVKELYSLLPNSEKVIVTRSIEEIANPYMNALEFNMALSSEFSKSEAAEFIMGVFPESKKYAVFGDSEEDEEMVDYLRRELVKGNIDTLVSIHVAKSERKASTAFDCSIGRDYSALVEIVRKYFIPSSSSQ